MESQQIYSQSLIKFWQLLEPYRKPGLLSPMEGNNILLILVELMVEGVEPDMLKMASRFLRPDEYEDILEERNILHLCGYPLCNSDPKGIKREHQINWRRPTMILPSTYLSRFCTREHYQASEFYQKQLSDVPIFSRPDVACLPYGACEYEIQTALLEEVTEIANNSNKSMKEVIEHFKSLSLTKSDVRPPNDPHLVGLSDEIKKVKLTERDPTIETLDAGPEPFEGEHKLVDGYMSRH